MKHQIYFKLLFLSIPISIFSQNYQWQWAKQGGGNSGSTGVGFNETTDEMIRSIAVDSQNNYYYLSSVFQGSPQLDGQSVTHYNSRDLLLFSTDCQGNIRWSQTIGGYGDGESAWKLETDNNGGLYIMANVVNQANINAPSTYTPTHFDANVSLPVVNVAYNSPDPNPGINTAFLLKYNTSNGTLAWQKPLQGNVNYALRSADNGLWCMDSSKNIHAILGFSAGTHLDGLITVPSSFTSTFQYYLVKFNYNNGSMTPVANPVLLPVTGTFASAVGGGKVQMLYDETLNRYYIAGSRSSGFGSPFPLGYNSNPINNDGFMLAINGSNGNEIWRKEFNTPNTVAQDDKIFGLIKDNDSNIYLSGYYYRGVDAAAVASFGDYSFPVPFNSGINPFVLKMNSSGAVQWAKIHNELTATAPMGYRFMRGPVVLNGNELAFVKGSIGDKWGTFQMTRPQNDLSDPLLVRLNKDTGAIIGTNEIQSNYGFQDELSAIAVDNDGNYVVGGLFHNQLFTDTSDGVNTMTAAGNSGKSQFFISKLAKSACSQLSVEESSAEAGIQFYPNPVKDILTINSKESLLSYEIYSATGQTVQRGNLESNKSSVNISSLITGVYYVKVKTDKAVVTEKIIKK
ncbi:hypothetical protein IX39_04025 [Chryseobacterium formosense]|uniref:Secretion system C-terminal sorting domain-containing protein n=1 Tax=Chryseobacterium formosense TaxID=236814 RepID=A0A085Z5X0_9FLAO|nr:T9SS type A sorting domain-containing protein [Chryseobacterium formosense]KFE99833.1 hypothetical protein IX39_04025 [Chryseobacterium formosense]SFT69222.1 Por secretion system C-terminal sorting domain-containing protein [Chryseobacterium formosense]